MLATYFLVLNILKIFSPSLEFFTLCLFLGDISVLFLHLFLQLFFLFLQFFFLFVKDVHDILNQEQISFAELRQTLEIAMEGKDLER